MGEKNIALSERLKMLARMATPGNRVADIGCDHGFLSIYLVQAGISPRVIAMDVRKGPLSAAREHVEARGLGAYIETRISDGLQELKPGEAETIVCAGMGGRLMERILAESLERAGQMKELILQPQSEIQEFRKFLRKTGFQVICEDMVREDGKYYFAMRAVPGGGEEFSEIRPPAFGGEGKPDPETWVRLCDKFGRKLLIKAHPLLGQYLRQQESALAQLMENLAAKRTERTARRLGEVQEELGDIRCALKLF